MILQKHPPRLRWRITGIHQVRGNGRPGEPYAEFEQLPVDSQSPQTYVGLYLCAHELASFPNNSWPAWVAVPTFPIPRQAETLPMPGDDCLRFDDGESSSPVGQKRERGTKKRPPEA